MFDGYFLLFDFTPLTSAPYYVYNIRCYDILYEGGPKNILFKILLMWTRGKSRKENINCNFQNDTRCDVV